MISYIEAIIYSIVQGITEWLPISSSGHLAILHELFGDGGVSYDVFLHLASILAIIFVFREDILNIFYINNKENQRLIVFLLVCIVPIGIVGVFFSDIIGHFFENILSVGVFFILSGLLIVSTKYVKNQKKLKKDVGLIDSMIIGLFQAFAILPGISRSGSTISSGLLLGVNKEKVIKFSFLMAIPLIMGAFLLEYDSLVMSNINLNVLLVSFIVTFVVSLISINVLIKIINNGKFYMFGYYNLIVGLTILIIKLIF